MKNSNTISFFIGVISATGLMLIFLAITTPKITSTTTTSTTTSPTEEPEKW